jgi:putative endonuclease
LASNHNKSTGKHYEDRARAYLLERGLILLKANYFCRFGEIDLIMLQQEVLCFIEVKFRNTLKYGGAAAAIPTPKQKKIVKSAQFFLSENKKYSQYAMRFDAFLIQQKSSVDPEVNWIQNAFYVE